MTDKNLNRPRSFRELPQYLHAAEVALLLGISESSVYKLMNQPGFPVIKLGSKFIVFDKDKLHEWLSRPGEASV